MVYTFILAGGKGTRFGTELPKQFYELPNKKTILELCVEQFQKVSEIDKIIIVTNPEYIDLTKKLLPDFDVIAGGEDRIGSIINACKHIKKINEKDIVLTHDAVRPFVSTKIIRQNIQASAACTTAVKSVDTLLYSTDGMNVNDVPNRSFYYNVQTPQTFNLKKLNHYLEITPTNVLSQLTDLCRLFRYHGDMVEIIEGDYNNFKITTPSDIIRAEMLLNKKQ